MIGGIGKLLRNSRGATAIEYALILGLVVVALLAGLSVLGGTNNNAWNNLAGKVVSAGA